MVDLCRTITLTDEPEENDAFSGPHQRIADAIAELIKPPDAKGISIGVEGSWGSGKSTVARLLTKRLEADENITTVYFDAWAHEGDPLRRTFLETIIRKLQATGWITGTSWDECIEELANRREVVETKDSLKITRWGRLIAFTLLLIPIGGAFITAALREDITCCSGAPASKFLIFLGIGLILTFMPFIVLWWKNKEEADLLSLFFNKGPTEKTTVTSKTVNPTSIEFEGNFNKLLEAALGCNRKRLVLILDNLDRVDAKDALSIWSTLQTFLQHKGMAPRPWHKRLWLLVLYDLHGLSLLWENSQNKSGKTASSFIDKSFQVRFEVPALVSSDWRKFLMDQLAKAFPDHSESDLHDVYRALATHVAITGKLLTIRELKLFVNQIGAIHNQWAAGGDRESDAFQLVLIAYYVLLRRAGKDVINTPFNADFPENQYQELLGDRARENLAAIAFNVEVDVAQQLLFADKIKAALTLGSSEELQKVASMLRRGFWEVFEQTAREWANLETVKVAEAAVALEESGLLNNAFRPSVNAVTKAFCDRAGAVEAWAPLDQKNATGIGIILKWKGYLPGSADHWESFVQGVFEALASGLTDHVKDVDEGEVTQEWLKCLTITVAGLEPPMKGKALTKVVNILSEIVRSEGLKPRRVGLCLEVLIGLKKNLDIGSVVEENLKGFADNGNIGATLSSGKSLNSRTAAFLIYVLVRYSSAFKEIPTYETAPEERERELRALFDEGTVKSFVAILEKQKEVSLLFSMMKAAPETKPLVIESLKLIINEPEARELFSGPDSLERFEFVFAHLARTPEQVAVLRKLISELQNQWDLLAALKATTFKAENAGLYLLALQTSSGEQEEFVSWCVEGLRSVPSDVWLEEFVSRTRPLFRLAFESTRRVEFQLGESYIDFLKKIIEWAIPDTEIDPFPGANIMALAGPLGSESRNLLQQHLEERLKRPSAVLPSWFFVVFDAEFATMLSQPRYVDLFELILARLDLRGLELLLSVFLQNPELPKKYAEEAGWNRFKVALRRALTIGYPDEYRQIVKTVAQTLSVTVPRNGDIAFAVYGEARICSLELKMLETKVLVEDSSPSDYVFIEPSWAPDGMRLAYTRSLKAGAVHSEIFLLDLVSGSHIPITGTDRSCSNPSWSPDGRMLAFVRQDRNQHDLYTIDVVTRDERRLTNDGLLKVGPKWSPDGFKLAFARGGSASLGRICTIDIDGSNEVQIYEGTGSLDPSWSPDGKQIAFARWLSDERSGIYTIRTDASDWNQLVSQPEPQSPIWSPDGTKLLFQSGLRNEANIYQVDADGQNLKLLTKGIHPTWQPLITDGPDETAESQSEP